MIFVLFLTLQSPNCLYSAECEAPRLLFLTPMFGSGTPLLNVRMPSYYKVTGSTIPRFPDLNLHVQGLYSSQGH